MAASTKASTSLKEYLKRYETNNEEDKKKKKKKKRTMPEATGVLVVDEDPIWQKPVKLEEEDDSAGEEMPQIDEDIEVKRTKRLELLKARRHYHAVSEDGSGWVSVSDLPKFSNSDVQNSDISPIRKQRARYDTPSPEPGLQPSESGREATDLSPPRQRQKRYHTPSPEPKTKSSHSTDLNPDISPPRRARHQASEDNKRKHSEAPDIPNISPPRRPRQSPSRHDVSRASMGADLSPPRKNRNDFGWPGLRDSHQQSNVRSTEYESSRASLGPDLSPPRKSRKEPPSLKERPKTGLLTGKDIKEENARTKKDDWSRFKDMDPSLSGRGAEAVHRDKITGQRLSRDEFLKSQKGEEKPKEEKKLEWGKGLAQKREAEAEQLELELEKDKPFARTRDDPELDKIMKEKVRWGDPMAHLVKKKNIELPDLGDGGKMKESGFIIPQDIPSHSWMKRGVDAAPNRYGIRPGRHWDGVDRSTGFEKQLFRRKSEKQATDKEAYMWSVSDM